MEIIHNIEAKSFVLPLENNLEAGENYTMLNNHMSLVYSEVPYKLRGQGIGKELVEKTFEKLTEEGYTATAVCSYIRVIARRSEKWRNVIKN